MIPEVQTFALKMIKVSHFWAQMFCNFTSCPLLLSICRYWSIPHLSTSALWLGLVIAAMYCMIYLLASVFPAPLSPEM